MSDPAIRPRASRRGQLLVALVLLVASGACSDSSSEYPADPQYPGSFVRALVGCEPGDAEWEAVQDLLGCSAITKPPIAGAAAAPATPPQGSGGVVLTTGGTAAPALAGAGRAGGVPPVPVMTAGSGGGMAMPPVSGAVMCGNQVCSGATPCCANAAAGACGALAGSVCMAMPAPSLPTEPCPSVDLTRMGFGVLKPCCTASKECGVNTQSLGVGGMPCTSLTEAKRVATSMGQGGLVPEPRACPAP